MNRSASTSVLPWVEVAPDAPYFVTEAGDPWTPIGHNDAITWPELSGAFLRRNLNDELGSTAGDPALFGSGDDEQAIVWLVRTDTLRPDGMLCRNATPLQTAVSVPGLRAGDYRITAWDTCLGTAADVTTLHHQGLGRLCIPLPPIVTDLALAIRRC